MLQLLVGATLAFQVPHALPAPRAMNARASVVCAGWTSSSSGLKYMDEAVGEGDAAKKGDVIKIHYTSRIAGSEEQLDSTRDPGKKAVSFELGCEGVIPGWTEGLQGMQPCVCRQRSASLSLSLSSLPFLCCGRAHPCPRADRARDFIVCFVCAQWWHAEAQHPAELVE